jgi:two-component system, chemotaxis family, CheB/CheR fusion protein
VPKPTKKTQPQQNDPFETLLAKSWMRAAAVVESAEDAMLMLDRDCRVVAGNQRFYELFSTTPEATVGNSVYELGSGQWNTPDLCDQLNRILAEGTSFKGFEVTGGFPAIGTRTMLLNGRQIHIDTGGKQTAAAPAIILGIDDITEMVQLAESLSARTNELEAASSLLEQKLGAHIDKLEREANRFGRN